MQRKHTKSSRGLKVVVTRRFIVLFVAQVAEKKYLDWIKIFGGLKISRKLKSWNALQSPRRAPHLRDLSCSVCQT